MCDNGQKRSGLTFRPLRLELDPRQLCFGAPLTQAFLGVIRGDRAAGAKAISPKSCQICLANLDELRLPQFRRSFRGPDASGG